VVTVINRVLRLSLPNYTAAEQTLQFTLGMKWARLLMAIVTSLVSGAVTRWISPSSRWAPLIVGSVVLAMFGPWHIANWSKFPAWYHLTFLLTIIPAVLVGALLAPRRNKDLNEVYSAPR
jgi:glycerol-3-phosphate acyltransferase PlsY